MYFDIDKNLKCAIFLLVNCVEDPEKLDEAVNELVYRVNLSDRQTVEAYNYFVYCCEKLGIEFLQ